jgi:hypothetical protein
MESPFQKIIFQMVEMEILCMAVSAGGQACRLSGIAWKVGL